MKIKQSSPKRSRKRSKSKKEADLPSLDEHPGLRDRFRQEMQSQEEELLTAEHQAKMKAQSRLHLAKLSQVRAQLQIQLFKIWNEMWLQRQKVLEQSHREWLKLLAS